MWRWISHGRPTSVTKSGWVNKPRSQCLMVVRGRKDEEVGEVGERKRAWRKVVKSFVEEKAPPELVIRYERKGR